QMLDFVEAAGISCRDVPRIEGRVPGLYSIQLNGAERSFSYWRDSSAARLMMQYPQQLWARIAASDLIYFSGITLAILSPDDAEALLSGLRGHMKPNAQIVFDPNIRPHLWDDAERMKQVISDAGALSDIVLPSFDDEKISFGDISPQDTALRYQSLGASQIVVKDGENPTILLNNGEISSYPVRHTSGVVDTTAAGDSFNGAYLSEVLKGRPPQEAIAVAQKCAALVVCVKGALVPFDQLDNLYAPG
ncbi:MAG: sugar kinase, partial [Paracoccaceae bacterium]